MKTAVGFFTFYVKPIKIIYITNVHLINFNTAMNIFITNNNINFTAQLH